MPLRGRVFTDRGNYAFIALSRVDPEFGFRAVCGSFGRVRSEHRSVLSFSAQATPGDERARAAARRFFRDCGPPKAISW